MRLSRPSTPDDYSHNQLPIARRIAPSGHNLSRPGYSTAGPQVPGSHMPDAHTSVAYVRSYISPLAMITPYFDASQMNCVFALDLFFTLGSMPSLAINPKTRAGCK